MKTFTNVPNTSRAVLAADGRGGAALITRTTPSPAHGEVLVKMAAAPVNPSDLSIINNFSGNPRTYPLPTGREGSGVVVGSGGGLFADFLLGRRVALSGGDRGTWAEYTAVPAFSCAPLRRALTYEQGSMLLVNPLTALALLDHAKNEGHSAIVNTAAGGGFGDMLRVLAKENRITLIDIVRNDEQVRRLRAGGARHVLNSSNPDFTDNLRRLTNELDARFFLDAVGGVMTEQLVEAAPPGSTIILYGVISQQNPTFSGYRLLNEGHRIEGFFLGNWSRKAGILRLLQTIYRAQRVLVSGFDFRISERFLLSEIDSALAHARHKASSGKALLVLDPDLVSIKGGTPV